MAIGMQPPTRHFLTEEEKEEKGKLEEMVDLALANPILFISTDHKKAMAMTDADANTVETDLRNRAPQPVRTDIGRGCSLRTFEFYPYFESQASCR